MPLKPSIFVGPASVIILVVLVCLASKHYHYTYDVTPLLISVVAYTTVIYGAAGGLATSAAALAGYVLFNLLIAGQTPFSLDTQISTLLFGAACAITTAVITRLRRKITDIQRWERQENAPAQRLVSGLERLPYGVVLLDRDTRAEFINRAFRDLFALPDALADRQPPLIALLYHCRDNHAYATAEDEVDHFIKRFTNLVRSGDFKLDMKLANGETLRVSCTAMADGGRMLTYTPITDLIRKDAAPLHHTASLQPRQPGDAMPPLAGSVVFLSKDRHTLSQG